MIRNSERSFEKPLRATTETGLDALKKKVPWIVEPPFEWAFVEERRDLAMGGDRHLSLPEVDAIRIRERETDSRVRGIRVRARNAGVDRAIDLRVDPAGLNQR